MIFLQKTASKKKSILLLLRKTKKNQLCLVEKGLNTIIILGIRGQSINNKNNKAIWKTCYNLKYLL